MCVIGPLEESGVPPVEGVRRGEEGRPCEGSRAWRAGDGAVSGRQAARSGDWSQEGGRAPSGRAMGCGGGALRAPRKTAKGRVFAELQVVLPSPRRD